MLDDSFGFFGGDETSTKAMVSSLNSWSIRKCYKVQFVFTGFGKEVNFLDLGIYLNRLSGLSEASGIRFSLVEVPQKVGKILMTTGYQYDW